MNEKRKKTLPWWLFAPLAMGGFITSGINIGIMSLDKLTVVHLSQAIVFGIFGILMSWGALDQYS